ncbi:guanine nucleotide exchange factor DBS isoform X7 [Drosophila bipectinata]|uniref:guanine nucleotide exchange factor DBS isoform X7 n=1 Tax=Drosophila bipectinata TaxID=42026 RepID=UPI0038B30F68
MNYVDNLRKIESDLNGTDVKSFGESQIKFCRAILDDSSVLESSDTPIQDTFIVSSLNSPSHYVSINLKPNLENALAINANDQLPTEAFKNLTAIITPTSAMSGDGVLNISDVADLLHSQYVIITGGRSIDGCPLIVFPDNNNFNLLEEEDYQKLILYITSVPSLQDADLGFHLIVDRRKDRWTSVKTVLQRISMYFPGIIHKVYILRPIGLFQKALSEVSSKFSKDEYRFHLVICSALSDLHEYVNVNQLTPDMGGDLIYSHNEWIQQRTSLEKFSFLTHQVSAQLDIFIKTIHDTEFPNSVNATEILIESQGNDYSRMKEEILIAAKHGESLLDNIKMVEEFKEFSERTGNVSAIQSAEPMIHRQQITYYKKKTFKQAQFYDDCRGYRRLLVQLEETERRFDEFWLTHHSRLQQCLNLRLFEQDFRELQTIFDGHLKTIASLTEVGENTERISILIKETKEFREATRINIERAGNILSVGQELIGSRRLYPWEVVQPKCDELKRVCDLIESQLSKRIDILSKNMELMERVEKANEWCANGVELLASQRIEKCSDSTDLDKLQDFITSASEFKLSSPSEFKKIILESTTPETKALVYQVLQRIDDVSLMCDKRIASLKQLTLKPQRPVQQVTPKPAVPLQPQGGAPSFVRRKSHKVNENSKTTPRSTEGEDIVAILPNLNHAEMQIKNKQDYEARCLKRGHVLTELLETEKIYVNEISSILTGYCDQLKSEEFMHLAPVSLFGKEDILFGNLNELYSFHNEVFLKDLENCISTTELVALCFVQRRDTFYRLYSYYCQNIPKSERLRETLVDTHLFFQGCQKRLGHKLPLAAYLLKPVQRITKYQLLLKDLLRYSDSGSCTKELQKALDCMLIVLKCVNDSMHQIAITGFPTNLAEQGELLMQDSFQVWTESKKDIRIRIKPRQRHIFLYQKSLLFCKQLTKPGHNKSTYQFKHHIKMSEVGLTESVRGDTKRFEVWLQGRQEVHVLQAPSIDVKMKWVSEIKRVLLNQLEELKGEKIKQYNFSHRGLMQTTSWDTSSFGPINHIGLDECLELPNRKSNCSVDNEKVGNTCKNGKDNLEKGGWSSDYSNSDDEYSFDEGNSLGGKFISLADYSAAGHSEVSMHEGDTIELLKIGCAGWWYVRVLGNAEGWVPAAYLESVNRKSSKPLSGI